VVLLLKEGKGERLSGDSVLNALHTVDAQLMLNEGPFGGVLRAMLSYRPEVALVPPPSL